MDKIMISEVTDITDPTLRDVATRVSNAFILAMQKGAAHAADPVRFPIASGADSVEEIIFGLVEQLPPERQLLVKGRALALIHISAACTTSAGSKEDRVRTYGELAQLDLGVAEPIVEQAAAIWRRGLPAGTRLVMGAEQAKPAPPKEATTSPAAAAFVVAPSITTTVTPALPMLQFRIRGAQCLTETACKTASDEMHLSGVSLDASGKSGPIADLKLGDFSGSDNFPYYPSPVVAEFDLSQPPSSGPDWPRAYFVTLLLAEIRQGGHGGFADAARMLLDAIQSKVREALGTAGGALMAGVGDGGPVGTWGSSIAQAVGWALSQVFAALGALFDDKMFTAVTLRIDIPSVISLLQSPKFSPKMSFERNGFGGAYRVYYDWHLGEDQTAWSDWEQLDGELTSAPATVSWDKHRIDVFVRGKDGQMWQKVWQDSHPWSNWIPLGGQLDSAPAAVSWGANRVDCFCRTKDNHLWHKWWDGVTWSFWEDLGGEITSAPAAASWGPDRIDVFARGTNNQLLHRSFTKGGGWADWADLGGQLLDAPAVVSPSPGSLHVYIHGLPASTWVLQEGESRNGISHLSGDGSEWGTWEYLGGSMASAPAACSSGPDREDVFARGTNGQLCHKGYTRSTGWGAWENLGGQLTDAPAVVANWGSNMIDCFIKGADNHLWQRWVWGVPLE